MSKKAAVAVVAAASRQRQRHQQPDAVDQLDYNKNGNKDGGTAATAVVDTTTATTNAETKLQQQQRQQQQQTTKTIAEVENDFASFKDHAESLDDDDGLVGVVVGDGVPAAAAGSTTTAAAAAAALSNTVGGEAQGGEGGTAAVAVSTPTGTIGKDAAAPRGADDDPATDPAARRRRYVSPKDFELLKVIGMGAFGKVVQVRNRYSKEILAMKIISKRLLRRKSGYIENIQAERNILTKVKHPFVVSMHCSFQTREKLFIIMDFLAGGELFLRVAREGIFLEREAAFYLSEIVLALDHLHSRGILHRDLKPENILLGSDGHVCLTDFGLAKDFGNGGFGDEDDDEQRASTICGTQEYMAPEMIARQGYGRAADYWSLGCIAYEMLSGFPPFDSRKGAKELFRKIMSERVKMPPGSTAAACKLLKGLLNRDVQKRWGTAKSTMFEVGGVAGLKKAEFFKDIDWDKLERKEIAPPKVLSVQDEDDLQHFHDEFTKMALPRSVVEMSKDNFRPHRVKSETFRGFSFIQDEFYLPEREEAEMQLYWNAVQEDGESVSDCASSKLDLEATETPNTELKKPHPRKRKKKKKNANGSVTPVPSNAATPVQSPLPSVAATPAHSIGNTITPLPSEDGDTVNHASKPVPSPVPPLSSTASPVEPSTFSEPLSGIKVEDIPKKPLPVVVQPVSKPTQQRPVVQDAWQSVSSSSKKKPAATRNKKAAATATTTPNNTRQHQSQPLRNSTTTPSHPAHRRPNKVAASAAGGAAVAPASSPKVPWAQQRPAQGQPQAWNSSRQQPPSSHGRWGAAVAAPPSSLGWAQQQPRAVAAPPASAVAPPSPPPPPTAPQWGIPPPTEPAEHQRRPSSDWRQHSMMNHNSSPRSNKSLVQLPPQQQQQQQTSEPSPPTTVFWPSLGGDDDDISPSPGKKKSDNAQQQQARSTATTNLKGAWANR